MRLNERRCLGPLTAPPPSFVSVPWRGKPAFPASVVQLCLLIRQPWGGGGFPDGGVPQEQGPWRECASGGQRTGGRRGGAFGLCDVWQITFSFWAQELCANSAQPLVSKVIWKLLSPGRWGLAGSLPKGEKHLSPFIPRK